MLPSPFLISPSADFWSEAANALLHAYPQELHTLRIVVPTFFHGQQLKMALGRQANGVFIAPRIHTLSAWIESQVLQSLQILQSFQSNQAGQAGLDLMTLYAELRQHAWLKKLFSAERNTDLMPLAQTLLALSDELTQAWLPDLLQMPDVVEQRWQAALAQFAAPGHDYLSNEAQLVWSIWKSRLDGSDANVIRWQQMMYLAQHAQDPLVWIHPVSPDAMESTFLNAYSQRQPVCRMTLDWRAASLMPVYAQAWPELMGETVDAVNKPNIFAPSNLSLYPASSLEQEAQHGAQTIIDWLQSGKSSIAIIAQDRLVARRIRALLERAQVLVKDETGWKLSTTRAAASLAAWLDVIATQANVVVLLDWLKSPFCCMHIDGKHEQVMAIEMALHQANVVHGWTGIVAALQKLPTEQALLQQIADQAHLFKGRKSLLDWSMLTRNTLQILNMETALAADVAGVQVLALLTAIEQDSQIQADTSATLFSFSEWRTFLRLQLDAAPFATTSLDHRVVMLPLNGARLRSFDAMLMVGCDATHLPSQANETLFFGNTVRRELGLPTREMRQQQQLRDFAALLHSSTTIVLSWQAYQNGQPQSASAWIERLQLTLECAVVPELPIHACSINWHDLVSRPTPRPAPSAAQLLPAKLSASGYNSLVACPYQFFATRMLGLRTLAELSEMPEKRDYGDWLHQILKIYHTSMPDEVGNREHVLRQISEQVFAPALANNPAVLAYYTRWQKVIPAYLEWASTWEEQGWYFVGGEQWHERRLQWAEGEIVLHGRIDRIDANDAGEYSVLDYKTRAQPSLKSKLATGEDHQLPFYGVLLQTPETPVASAHYIALELNRDKTGAATAPDYANWQHLLETSIVSNLRAIQNGTALPANGIASVCEYCEVRGVCRKGAW